MHIHDIFQAVRTELYVRLSTAIIPSHPEADRSGDGEHGGPVRDLGAVSLEQVLWFVAAGVSVAVIASILWGQIKSQAETGVVPPATP